MTEKFLNHFPRKIIKKNYADKLTNQTPEFTALCSRPIFSERVVANFPWHFSKLDIYFCPFFLSDAISFPDFYNIFSVEIFNLAIKDPTWGGFLISHPFLNIPLISAYLLKALFQGFSERIIREVLDVLDYSLCNGRGYKGAINYIVTHYTGLKTKILI